ncbi:MAG: DUF4417 domain-containing protein [Ruminococcus sp.]|nr:DUF4417 domain-containing protein [Ruminococcus sp.]
MPKSSKVRKGIKDTFWRPFMVTGAVFSDKDIPFCPTTAKELPVTLVTYSEAKEIYRRECRRGNVNFIHMAYVCFYEDDIRFDSFSGIWFRPKKAHDILSHFSGIITPDFSAYQDFPYPLKIFNTYRMRAFGYWYGVLCGGNVINNVRWGTPETYSYCFDGIPRNSVTAIGTVGGSPRKRIDRPRFEAGFNEMVRVLNPHTIIVYGSANYPCFRELEKQGIKIVSYQSKTAKAFAGRGKK